jgi:sugar lactone lactonase YvrE
MTLETTVLLDGLTFPESPRWREDKLWFSDFYSHRVLTVDLDGRTDLVGEFAERPSGLGWRKDGTLLVVSMLDRRLYALAGGRQRLVADLSAIATGPCNDMVVDSSGHAFVGNFGFDRHRGEAQRAACLACVRPDGTIMRAAENLLFPNGMVITPDGGTLIVAESLAGRLTAFDLRGEGTLTHRRVFAALENSFPDGICLDAEGAVWIADPHGKRVIRVFQDGRIAACIATGERGAYACMLGGADRRTLFICTSAAVGPAAADLCSGRIEFVGVDIPGTGLP